jgi:hypothetical protein
MQTGKIFNVLLGVGENNMAHFHAGKIMSFKLEITGNFFSQVRLMRVRTASSWISTFSLIF